MRKIITVSILTLLYACSGNKPSFRLSNEIHLNEYGIISPFFIEQLLEPPFRSHHGWNDSLMKISGIHNLKIKTHGLKNPEATAEERIFFFSRNGQLSKYSYVKFEDSDQPVPFTEIEYNRNIGTVSYYFGVPTKQSISNSSNRTQYNQIWKKDNGSLETFKLIGTVLKPKVLLSYQGDNLTRCSVILRMNEPVKRVEEILNELDIEFKKLGFTEKSVIYVDEKYLPLEMYHLNESMIQTVLQAEWKYENHKKLISYKRYINGSLLKDFSFDYREDHLLDGFIYNRVRYSVAYQ